jgi:hypothetical protein
VPGFTQVAPWKPAFGHRDHRSSGEYRMISYAHLLA